MRLPFSIRLALAAALLAAGCSSQTNIDDIGGAIPVLPSSAPDFLKTEITASSGIADGVTELVVAILLKNSDDSIVANYKPTYEIVSGSGVITAECSTSNSVGMSYCVLKSTVAGSKKMKLTNALVGLTKEILFGPWFNNTTGRQLLAASSQQGTATGGYKVEASVGEIGAKTKFSTATGYKVYTELQGALSSR